MSEKYSTDELVEFIKWIRTDITDSNTSAFDAIIARLRAADAICAEWRAWRANPTKGMAAISKAIADYEGKQ